MDENKLLNLALEAGEIMLSSGAETHRVEDTIERILKTGDNCTPEAFVTPTGLFVSIHVKSSLSLTKFKRIKKRGVNLEKISLVNSLSRNFVEKKISLDEALLKIDEIRNITKISFKKIVLCYGIVSMAFTLMFNGTFMDSCLSFAIGIVLGIFVQLLEAREISSFLISLFGGALIAALAMFFNELKIENSFSIIIIGSLMPLVPGVAITNAIRDIMAGDFLSGTSRLVEAVLIAVSIAGGAGIVLRIFSFWGGNF